MSFVPHRPHSRRKGLRHGKSEEIGARERIYIGTYTLPLCVYSLSFLLSRASQTLLTPPCGLRLLRREMPSAGRAFHESRTNKEQTYA